MKLSDRVRSDVEAAPWVIQEIIKLEGELFRASIDLRDKRNSDSIPRKHNQYEHNLIEALFDVDSPDVDHDAIDKACITRLYIRSRRG